MKVFVISDTHAPRFWKQMPPPVAKLLEGVDLILHAGDVCMPGVLDELAEWAPVKVVLGNNDGQGVADWGAPETHQIELAGVNVAMIHDSGPTTGRIRRMRRRFPDADLVVYGHSHIPMDLSEGGLRVFNPGSPTDKRRQPQGTVGLLHIDDGDILSADIIAVTD